MKAFIIALYLLTTSCLFSVPVQPAGAGTSASPYEIANLDNLEWLSVNSDQWHQKYYVQTDDIDATDTQNWNGGEGFSPIGNDVNEFWGSTFNGNGFTIDGLYINLINSYDQGMFGYSKSSTLNNIHLVNVSFTGGSGIGGLVGFKYGGTITNCRVLGTISGSDRVGGLVGDAYSYSGYTTITRCSTDVTVSGTEKVGGLIGNASTHTVSYCSSIANVTATSNRVGGLIGYTYHANVLYSFSEGDVFGGSLSGGLVGHAPLTYINNCYNRANVSGTQYIGGITSSMYESNINRCFSTGQVSGSSYVGAILGERGSWAGVDNTFWDYEVAQYSWSDGGTAKTTTDMQDVDTFTDIATTGLNSAWDFVDNPNDDAENVDIWRIHPDYNDGYPTFSWLILDTEFEAVGTEHVVGEVIQFNDLSIGEPTSWEWDFNDDGTIDATEQNPTFTFTSAGTYTVTLTAHTAANTDSETITDYITIFDPDVERNLVAFYPFNGNTLDESGNEHHGINYGASQVADRFGNPASAYDFDGSNDYMEMGSWFNYNDFSISLWINRDMIGSDWRTIIDNNHPNNWVLQSYQNSNTCGFGVYPDGNSEFTLALNEWKHVVCIKDGTNLRTYVNGILEDSTQMSATVTYSNPYLRISRWGTNGRYFNGQIDDIRMYDRGISESEVALLYGETIVPPTYEMSLVTSASEDFGNVYFGQDDTKEIILSNDGTADVTITNVEFEAGSSDTYTFDYAGISTPIEPGATASIFVTFTPSAEDVFTGTLNISNNSTNNPMIQVTFTGNGEYDSLPAPSNVGFTLDNGNAVITWDAVTTTEHGIAVTPDFYIVNYSETVESDPNAYYHLVITDQTSFTHQGVSFFADQMFYQVIAVRDYAGEYPVIFNINQQQQTKTMWLEFKRNHSIR